MPTICFDKKCEEYLRKSAQELRVAFGIIIGQSIEDKFNIIHLAKLSEDEESLGSFTQDTIPSIENVDVQSLAEQWLSASKMTSGSFKVIGVFMSSLFDFGIDQNLSKHVSRMMGELSRLIINSSTTYEELDAERNVKILFLEYSVPSSRANFKIFSGGKLVPAEFKLVDKLPQWFLFESNYELDDVFPITDNQEHVNIENQFNAVLQSVKLNIYNSEVFIQQQNVDDDMTLENYLKTHSISSKKNEPIPVFHASILLTANISNEYLIKIRQFNGTVRFTGIVSSRVWAHGKNTFKEIKDSIRRDVLRSLSARIQIYCDGLTDINSKTEGIILNEPPRRIYFCNPYSEGIQFSEYIFRGETPSVAVAQAKQILDMDITSDYIFDDLEGLPDDDLTLMDDPQFELVKPPASGHSFEMSRSVYMLGILVSLLILLVSVLLNYIYVNEKQTENENK